MKIRIVHFDLTVTLMRTRTGLTQDITDSTFPNMRSIPSALIKQEYFPKINGMNPAKSVNYSYKH